MKKRQLIGIGIFILLVLVIICIKFYMDRQEENINTTTKEIKTITVATGGGKEDFIADEDVINILRDRYGLNVIYDSWSNGKLILNPLVRENGDRYDLMFCSDQRFYDYYKLAPNKEKNEADRYTVLDGGLTLNTPIVIYSWGEVVDALIKDNIVTEREGIYYITDMNKLLNYILEGKKWSELGLDMLYGSINIS